MTTVVVILVLVVLMQAHYRPYRMAKHNKAAHYLLTANTFVVFSSVEFLSSGMTETEQLVVLYFNLVVLSFEFVFVLSFTFIDT